MAISMTAFGRAQSTVAGKRITCEIRSVNGRYLDLSIRLPRAYGFLEEKVKTFLQNGGISRGKVDVSLVVEQTEAPSAAVEVNLSLAKSYYQALCSLRDALGLQDDISVMRIAQNRDLFTEITVEEDPDTLWAQLQPVLSDALTAFLAARRAEGKRLCADLAEKKARLVTLANQIAARAEIGVSQYRARLEEKLNQVLAEKGLQYEEARVLTECAIFADRIAVDEELVRLNSHFEAFDAMLAADEPVGRKLDFLLQEMNREVNTTGSKANDLTITKCVIEMKNELEKIREQVQNLE